MYARGYEKSCIVKKSQNFDITPMAPLEADNEKLAQNSNITYSMVSQCSNCAVNIWSRRVTM